MNKFQAEQILRPLESSVSEVRSPTYGWLRITNDEEMLLSLRSGGPAIITPEYGRSPASRKAHRAIDALLKE